MFNSFFNRFAAKPATPIPTDFTALYVDSLDRFAFKHPVALRVEVSQRGDERTILARNAPRTVGFQLKIRPIGGLSSAITPARLARDVPGMALRDHQPLRLRGAGKGLLFHATDRNFGESVQAWFIRRGRLYQISAYLPHEPLVRGVLASWRFTD